MKNRYCLYCGTLLPEDGICLRCGAKYEIDAEGQLKVIPRKVKKVSVKTAPSKKYSIKRKLEPSEADTQTIHIPEDVYSFSDDAEKREKHTDWTGEDAKANSHYVPNFVLHNESENHHDEREVNNADIITRQPAPSGKKLSPTALVAVFMIITLLSASLSYLLLKEKYNGLTAETKTITAKAGAEEKDFTDYSPVLDAYRDYEQNGFRRVTSDYINENIDYTVDAKTNKIAYVYSDLNSDGRDELLISLTDEKNIFHQIYDVYTYSTKPIRLVPEETWFHPDSNEELCFYSNGDICFSEGPMEEIGDSRIKAYSYIIYDFPAKADHLSEKVKYHLTVGHQNGMNELTAERTTAGNTEPCSIEEFGEIDDKYRGYLINNEPYEETYLDKWNPDNPVLQIADYSWKHLIEKVFNDGISDDNRIAITTYQDILDKLYWSIEKQSSIPYDEDKPWPFSIITDEGNDLYSDWSEKRKELEENGEFFIDDIDNDGVLELGLKNTIGPTASHGTTIYRCTGLAHAEAAVSGYNFEFFDNGVLAGLASHNHTTGDLWPTYYYKLDNQNDYTFLGLVYSWDKSIYDEGFPAKVDVDNNGVIYTTNDGKSWIDDQAFNAWFNETVRSTKREVQWYKINENNVNKFKQIALSKIK